MGVKVFSTLKTTGANCVKGFCICLVILISDASLFLFLSVCHFFGLL